nr:MAG TPA: tail collar fiber protein [Caudoviricetes sp.]
MAEYSKLVITNDGQALMAKMIAGSGNIDFTKICSSSTQYQENQLQSLTALSNIKQTTLVSKVSRTNNVAIKVEAAFSNVDITTGYYMRTLGLYAVDPDKGEILYAACIETSNNCYMPPYNGVTVSAAYIQLYTTVGNADSVSLEVNPGAYATIGDIQELEAEIADLKAFVGYTDGDIYGVEVDFKNKKFTRLAGAVNRTPGEGFDNILCFGGRKRCNLTNDGRVAAYYGEAGFSTTGKLTQTVDRNPAGTENSDASLQFASGTIVQVMVEQPKFYYKVVPLEIEKKKKGGITRKVRYYVSDTPKAGFKLHPAFIENGNENEKIYLAAFEGSLYDSSASAYILDDSQVADFAADLLCSIANAKPLSGLTQNATRANVRKLAEKRGSGWEQAYIATTSASQMLMLIEYASFNMQSAIGQGAVNKTDDGSSNMAEATGVTINLGNASGTASNANGVQFVSYRGEENFWGNIWGWIDGINEYMDATTHEGTIYIADHSFADDTGTGAYEDAGIIAVYGNGYISAFCYSEKYDWLFIPGELLGSSALPVGDYCWNGNTGWRVAVLGARWGHGLNAGAFCWHLNSASSHRYRDVGGRLVYVPSKAAA